MSFADMGGSPSGNSDAQPGSLQGRLRAAGQQPDGAGQRESAQALGQQRVLGQGHVEPVRQHQKAGQRGLGVRRCQFGHRGQPGAHGLQQGRVGIPCLAVRGGRRREQRPIGQGRQQPLQEGAGAVARIPGAEAVVVEGLLLGLGVAQIRGQPRHQERLADPRPAGDQAETGHTLPAGVAALEPGLDGRKLGGPADYVLGQDAGLAQEVVPAEALASRFPGGRLAVQMEQGAEGLQVEGQ